MGGDGSLLPERSGDGMPDLVQPNPNDSSVSMAEVYWPGVTVDRYEVLRAALRVVLENLGEALRNAAAGRRVEVGLMAMHADDCVGAGPQYSPDFSVYPPSGCSQGAYVLKGFTDISEAAELEKLLVALAALPDPGRRAPWMAAPWSGHPYRIRDVYLELFRYLSGQAVFNGFLGTRDYGSRSSGNLYHFNGGAVANDVVLIPPGGSANQPLLAPATDILAPLSFDIAKNTVDAARYTSPIGLHESCPSVTMVNLQFGEAGASHRDTNEAIAAPFTEGGLGMRLAAGVPGDSALVARLATEGKEAAGRMPAATFQSYFFARDASVTSETMAVAGGTGRARSLADPARMVAALESVFADVAGESRTLVAASTLVNDRGQSRFGRDIYFALFQPEAGPWWPGNIKKLKIADSGGGNAEIIAQAPLTSSPKPAISSEDGLILPDALTFWTDPRGADVLAFDPGRQEVMGRDGRSVARGGAGQQIRGLLSGSVGSSNSEPGARQVFTLDPQRPGELLPLDVTPATSSIIGPLLDPAGQKNEEQKLALIGWIRGQDGFDADGDGNRDEPRRWILADPLHSRPLAVSYGARPGSSYSLENPDIRLFFGTNDGLFHVVRNTWPSGAESGQESWAFLPTDMLGRQFQLAQNRVTGQARPYGIDGEAVALITDRGRDGTINPEEGDTVWVYISQRRGGTGMLAFDMTDPDKPRYMWAIDNRSPGFEQLALTFSTPRIAHLDLGQTVPAPALVFAGGYNGGWVGSDRTGKDAGGESDLIGNAIYVVNPADGSLIWRAVGPDGGEAPVSGEQLHYVERLEHSIASPLSLMDSDHNGVDDRGYFGDTGGNLWRIDFTEAAYRSAGSSVEGPDNWYLSRLATLGGTGDSDRRFFHAPDIVKSKDSSGGYDGVVITSGNRAAPRDIEVRNFAYLVKDRGEAGSEIDTSSSGYSHDQLVDITLACHVSEAANCVAEDLAVGWKLELQSPGEKGLSAPLISSGTVFFTSYVPQADSATDSCIGSQGSSRAYAVKLADGSPALPGAGNLTLQEEEEPPRHLDIGPGLQGDVVPYRDRVLLPGRGLEEGPLLFLPGRTRWRAYWREEGVDDV
jgi:type IV pilus assembly protein PilY1